MRLVPGRAGLWVGSLGLPLPRRLGGMSTLAVSKTAHNPPVARSPPGKQAAPGPEVARWRVANPAAFDRGGVGRQCRGGSWRGGRRSPLTVLAGRSAAARSERRELGALERPPRRRPRAERRRGDRGAEPTGRESLVVAGGAAGDLARKAVCEPYVIPAEEDTSSLHRAEKGNAARSSNPAKGPSHLVPPLPPLAQPLS